jgi:hypothetical protein
MYIEAKSGRRDGKYPCYVEATRRATQRSAKKQKKRKKDRVEKKETKNQSGV